MVSRPLVLRENHPSDDLGSYVDEDDVAKLQQDMPDIFVVGE